MSQSRIPFRRHSVSCEGVLSEMRAASPEAVLGLETSGNMIGDWDTDRLAQVISNLVGNAIQHGEGMPITLTAQEEEGDAVTLAVHNGGQPDSRGRDALHLRAAQTWAAHGRRHRQLLFKAGLAV